MNKDEIKQYLAEYEPSRYRRKNIRIGPPDKEQLLDKEMIKQLCQDGKPIQYIADYFMTSNERIKVYCQRHNIPLTDYRNRRYEPITTEKILMAINMRNKKIPWIDIQKHLDVSAYINSVTKTYCNENNIEMDGREKRIPLREDQVKEIERLKRIGMGQSEISHKLNIKKVNESYYAYCKENNIEAIRPKINRRKKVFLTEKEFEICHRMRKENYIFKEIGEVLGYRGPNMALKYKEYCDKNNIQRVNIIQQRKYANNSPKVLGVNFNKYKGMWYAQWSENKEPKKKFFHDYQSAVDHRKEMERLYY